MTESPAPTPAGAVVAEARDDVARLAQSGTWTPKDDQELARQFTRARTAAMRAPRITERSILMRRIARLVLPRRVRPPVRHALSHLERAVGEWRDRDKMR